MFILVILVFCWRMLKFVRSFHCDSFFQVNEKQERHSFAYSTLQKFPWHFLHKESCVFPLLMRVFRQCLSWFENSSWRHGEEGAIEKQHNVADWASSLLCTLIQMGGYHKIPKISSSMYTPISKNVVGENGEWQLSNGNCTTERNCGFPVSYTHLTLPTKLEV